MSVELFFNHQPARVEHGATLFDGAETLGIKVPTSCRKQGKCKECLVEITAGMQFLSPKTPEEKHLRENFRLSCRCRIEAETGVVRCHTMRRGEMRIERQAARLPGTGRPMELAPTVTRQGDRILRDGVEIDRGTGPLHGLAMDLGTTTIVLRLHNLETGEIVAEAAFENPQRFAGSDVMARIAFDTGDGTYLLQRTLAGYISHAIEEFPADPASIYELAVAGNSTMRDLFFRLDVYSIGQNPYRSITEVEMAEGKRSSTSLETSARRLGLPLHPKARAYGLPIVSGHVGADAAACLLAVNMMEEERLVALMDIGTNTELLLGNRERILAASCPAGPAFEGGKIACGMPGLTGAVEKAVCQADGAWRVEVIGGGVAEGVCGSGLVDVLAELRRTEQMNALGRFEHSEKVVLTEGGDATIYLSEADINELAQAKGANVAGLHVIFQQFGARFDDVDVFYLAGGFGRHLNIGSARRIGLIPDIDEAKIVQVGNASIEGASQVLLSQGKRAQLEKAVRQARHCRLETDPQFFNYFVEGCQFRPVETIEEANRASID